jgi:hypothetical protein
VTNAKLADMATARLKGRATAGSGDPEDLTPAQGRAVLELGALATLGSVGTAHITDNATTNAKLADMASATIKGRATAGTGDPEDLTAAQVRSLLNIGTFARNRIINGAMHVSQERGTAHVDVTTGAAYAVDQWQGVLSATPGGTLRLQQVASLTPGGSPFRLRATAQAADTSIAAGDFYLIGTPIEGTFIADAAFGTASARQLVLRMGVRSSIAGTFGVRIVNSAANRSWLGTITIAAGEVNTDLLRTLIIPGDTTGTWLTDTGIGLSVQVALAAGTTFHGTAGWNAANRLTTSAQTNLMGTANATFDLFDVGLYVDAANSGVAPQWEPADFADEFRRCQRYWQQVTASARGPATGASSVFETPINWPVLMRATPAAAITAGTRFNLAATWPQVLGVTARSFRFAIVAAASGDTGAVDETATGNARL